MFSLISLVGFAVCALGHAAAAPVDNNSQAAAPCSEIRVRKEILDLTPEEWNIVKDVTTAMHDKGWFAWYGYLHDSQFLTVHGNSQFLPWHRRFVLDFEDIGRRFNPKFVMPYWDEFRNYQQPETSKVLTPQYVGGNGAGANHCVVDGLQANWMMKVETSHCLQRVYDSGSKLHSWFSPEYVTSQLQRSRTMEEVRPAIEYGYHGQAHVGIGGDMGTRPSPNDFIFWIHHAGVDWIWDKWQKMGHQWDMDGPNASGLPNCNLDTKLFVYEEPFRDVMKLGNGKMCYKYADSSSPIRMKKRSEEGSSSEADNVKDLLPNSVLQKWFPDYAGDSKIDEDNTPRVNRNAHAAADQIPKPVSIPDEWIDMHQANKTQVQAIMDDANSFVEEMNKAGYVPNY